MSVIVFGIEDLDNQLLDKVKVINQVELPKSILIEQNANDFLEYTSDSVVLQFPPYTSTVQVAKGGIVHDARMPPAQMEQVVYAYTTLDAMDSLLPSGKARYLIKVKNRDVTKASLEYESNVLTALIEKHGGTVTEVSIPDPGEHMHQPIIDGISFLQKSFGVILVVLGITLLSLILLTWLYPQLIQVGIMKALGASTSQINRGYYSVLSLIILLGLMIGIPLGFKSAALFNRFIALLQNFQVVTE